MQRVLIIEDEGVVRRQLVHLFRLEDFDVVEADCGEAGIEAAKRTAPDLVICDIMMPGIDGFGVLAALRQLSETALTPFIFLTAKAGGKDVRLGMNEGADDYITKPFDPATLLAAARRRLSRRQAQLAEAGQRAAATGVLAAAALPREMESCLAQLESLSDALLSAESAPRYCDIGHQVKAEVGQLRRLSKRLRLYAELPNLYSRRFSSEGAAGNSPVTAAVQAARTAAAQHRREADLQVAAAEPTIPLSPDTVDIILGELVDNACKFSPPGTPVRVELARERALERVVVSDQGSGLTPQQIRDLGAFQQFWNGSDRPRGLGIGLVLVQTLVRLQAGEVQIDSEPGSGTRVTVLLPSE